MQPKPLKECSDTLPHNQIEQLYNNFQARMMQDLGLLILCISFPLNVIININVLRDVLSGVFPVIVYIVNLVSIIVGLGLPSVLMYLRKPFAAVISMMVVVEFCLLVQVVLIGRFDIFILSFLPMLVPALTLNFRTVALWWLTFCTFFVLEVVFLKELQSNEQWLETFITLVTITSSLVFGATAVGAAMRRVQRNFVVALHERDQVENQAIMARELAEQREKANLTLTATNDRLLRAQKQFQLLLNEVDRLTRIQERARMARDMHDSVGQHLYAAQLLTGGLRAQVEAPQAGRLRELERNIGEAQKDMRQAILALQDKSDLLLEDALAEPLDHCHILGLTGALEVQGESRQVPPSVRHMLYHIALEAVTNTGKHAQARRVQITLDYTDSEAVVLTIADDGHGFTEHVSQPGYGNGLRNMHDRAEALGGECEITSSTEGVTICVKIPTPSVS